MSSIAQAAGQGVAAIGSLVSGYQADEASKAERAQYYNQGNEAAAVSERDAQNAEIAGKLTLGRQQAVAAASGAGATDPTVLAIQGETARLTTYDALTKVWEGQTERDKLRYQGDVVRQQGRQSVVASGINAITSLLGAGKTMADRYGGSGPGNGATPGAADATGSGFDLSAFLSTLGG